MAAPENPPDTTVHYTVTNDPEAGSLFLYGDSKSSKIVLLCGGYADDHSVFQAFAAKLAKENFCFAGVMCLPGYDDRPERPWKSHKKGGYTLDEMSNSIRDALKSLRAASTNKDADLTVIFHDWGVLIGSMFIGRIEKEETSDIKPSKVVYCDVLLPPHPDTKDIPDAPKPSYYETTISIVYKIVFAVANLLQTYVSNIIALIYFFLCLIPLAILKLGPIKKFDEESAGKFPKDFSRMIYMAYPYVPLVLMTLFGSRNPIFLHTDLKEIPVLYMSGLDKRTQFHDSASLKLLEREEKEGYSKSKVVTFADAGHYFFLQKEQESLDEVKKFMLA